MPQLYDTESGKLLGTITEEELEYLMDQLEEESLEDQDYYIDLATLAWFGEHQADSALLVLLREAIGDREGIEIRWTRSQ